MRLASSSSLFGLLLLSLVGCSHSHGYEGSRRNTELFQEATGPVIVYPVDKNRIPKNRDSFMLPQKVMKDLGLPPVSPGPLEDLLPLPPPRKIHKTPKTEIPSLTTLPQRQVNVRLSKRDVQFLLKELGLYKGPLDGAHGPQTQQAIKDFQARNGLVVDGVAGPKTKRSMVNAVQKHYIENTQRR